MRFFNFLSASRRSNRLRKRSHQQTALYRFEKLECRNLLTSIFPAYIDGNLDLGNADGDSPYALSDTFRLESNPDSDKIVYLDFNGHFSVGNDWNHAINFPSYNTDGSASSFSNAELTQIQEIFQSVAEDFLPFDINVTTRNPGEAALTNSGGRDDSYGIRVVLSQITAGFGTGTGGLAIRNSFTDRQDTPTFVFNKGVNVAATTASHEVGHTLGLTHDGLGDLEYHPGVGRGETSWGPLLGAPFGENLTQWSNGDYEGSTNRQDDLRVITRSATGVDFVSDDVGDSFETAHGLSRDGSTVFDWGTITSRDDVDVYRLNVGRVDLDLSIEPLQRNGNLDVLAQLYSSDGTLIATSNPADLISARFSETLSPGTYYLTVDGGGKEGVYSDYGSLGFYSISGTIESLPPINTPADNVQDNPNRQGDDSSDTENRNANTNDVDTNFLGDTIGLAGSINYADEFWRTVQHDGAFDEPVVIAELTSRNDANPATVRIRNVTPDSFEIRVQNWDYLDQDREQESVSYLVVESGIHQLEDGTTLAARTGVISDQTRRIGFGGHFDQPPVVLSQTLSANDESAVTSRTWEVTRGSFSIELQEEEASDGIHAVEQFGYVAIERSSSSSLVSGNVKSSFFSVDDMAGGVQFENSFDSVPIFFARTQTMNGTDTATTRTISLTENLARVFVEEERSGDDETSHLLEEIGYLALSRGDLTGEAGSLANQQLIASRTESVLQNDSGLLFGLEPEDLDQAVIALFE